MIIEAIVSGILSIGAFVITLLPKISPTPMTDGNVLLKALSGALWFFPVEMWIIIVGNVMLWLG